MTAGAAHLLCDKLHLASGQSFIGIFPHAQLPFDAHHVLRAQLIEPNAVVLAHNLSAACRQCACALDMTGFTMNAVSHED